MRGQVLLLAIILLAVGMLMLSPLLSQLATMFQKGGNEREQRMKVYATEAAISRVIADLIRGADGVGTTYTTTQPHTGAVFQTFTITTSYSPPSVTVNNYTPTITISLPTATQARPSTQQNYVDPGVTHPNLATISAGYAYLMHIYNVKAGTIQVNWAYSPAGISRIGVWAGWPVNPITQQAYLPGPIDRWPIEQPILDTGFTPAIATFNRTAAISVDPATDGSGGVYTIVLDNSRGTQSKTTAAFVPSGGTGDTWVWVKAYKDYIVTATVGSVSVTAYLRQVPGFTEPPGATFLGSNSFSYTFGTSNISFITNEVYAYTWLSP